MTIATRDAVVEQVQGRRAGSPRAICRMLDFEHTALRYVPPRSSRDALHALTTTYAR